MQGPMDVNFICADVLVMIFLLVSGIIWLAGHRQKKLREVMIALPPTVLSLGLLCVTINLIYQLTGYW